MAMRQLKVTQSITNRSEKSVDRYFSDISRIPMITAEREIELAQKIRQGDDEALKELVQSNLRFVVSVAKQYQNRGVSLPDLINDGNCGLIKAAKRFDETRGFKFISYGVWWVRQSLLDSIANHGRLIRVPLNKIALENKFNKAYDKLEQQLGRRPNDEEIVSIMDISEKEIKDMSEVLNTNKVKSYDSPLSHGESTSTLLDVVANKESSSADSELMMESLKNDISRTINSLPDKERLILEKYYGLNGRIAISLHEIGIELQLTQERVRQLREHGLRKLRTFSKSKLLKKYL